MTNYYKILGVRNFASDEEFKTAYRKLSQRLHPDKNDGDPFFTEKFKELQEAYEHLSTSDKKSRYDMKLREYLAGVDQTGAYKKTSNNTGASQHKSSTSGSGTAKAKSHPGNKQPGGKASTRSVTYGIILLFAVMLGFTMYFTRNDNGDDEISSPSSLSVDSVSDYTSNAIDSVSSVETNKDILQDSNTGEISKPAPVAGNGKVERSFVSGEIKDDESSGSDTPGSDYFTVGSTTQKVLQVQGNPSGIRKPYGSREEWTYAGGSSVTFEDGRVKEFDNYRNGLKVRLIDESTITPGSAGYFTVGSTRQRVLQVQGNPSGIRRPYGTREEWTYTGGSSVTFEDGRVKEFDNYRNGLKVKLIDESTVTPGSAGYFTVGSTRQRVLQVQGNPTGIRRPYGTREEWTYTGGSSVTFEDGRVKEFDNYRNGLKVRL